MMMNQSRFSLYVSLNVVFIFSLFSLVALNGCRQSTDSSEILQESPSNEDAERESSQAPGAPDSPFSATVKLSSGNGTWFKAVENPRSAESISADGYAEKLCFLKAGHQLTLQAKTKVGEMKSGHYRIVLAQNHQIPMASSEDSGAVIAGYANEKEPCPFTTGFIFEDHLQTAAIEQAAPSEQSSSTARALRLADYISTLRTGNPNNRNRGGAPCLQSSYLGNCWACVSKAMVAVGAHPGGLDGTPKIFLNRIRASGQIRAFKNLKAEFKSNPYSAPKGSIVFCNTSRAGHAAVVFEPGKRAFSDVRETPSNFACNSGNLLEILMPLD